MADRSDIKEQMTARPAPHGKDDTAQFRSQIQQEMAQWKQLVEEIIAKEKAKESDRRRN